MYSRRGLLYNENLPEITKELQKILTFFRLDGGIVHINDKGQVTFQGSQKRCSISKPEKVEEYRKKIPVTYYVWDMPMLGGKNLMSKPYIARRYLLEQFFKLYQPLLNFKHIRLIPMSVKKKEMFDWAIKHGLEGVVLKQIDSPYVNKRSKSWIKIKLRSHTPYILGSEQK